MTGAEVLAQIDGLVAKEDGVGFMGYGVQHMWTHKSGLERLPYFKHLALPHNMDVMHTEKYTNSSFMEPNLLVLSYSNAGGLILRYRDSTLILG